MKSKDEIKEYLKKKKETAQGWLKKVKEETFEFIGEYPGLIIPIASGLGMIATGGYQLVKKQADKAEEKCLVEDDVTGLDFKTKKPLTNAEILELGERMIDGQTKGDALNDMGLLKKERKR